MQQVQQLPHTPHIERHFEASDAVRDVVIGMSDGLTVPFALAADSPAPDNRPKS
jgi:vacuolar iron transporter family protein